MEKVALLIGVSEYEPGLASLPGAVKDIDAMQRVLQQAEVGGFTQVESLPNPDPVSMQVAIETLFSGRNRDDLVLLFFSGHGIKDEDGRLYFATRSTRKAVNGELRKATAVPASFVHDMMSKCRSKRQVVILDCCFSGAFTEGLSAKDDGSIDVKSQLGGEGRVVLTSSSALQYSFEQQGYDLSIYTHYLVEGMETGAADRDNDGFVSIDELHTYASAKVQEAVPAMQPGRHVVRQDGEKILLTKALIGDLKLRYRKEVEKFASRGEISPIGRSALEKLQVKLNILPEEAIVIENEILKPYREYQNNLQQYRQMLANALQQEGTLSKHTRAELKELQNILGLRDEDIQPVVKQVTELKEASPPKEAELESIALMPQLFVSPSNVQLSPQPTKAGQATSVQINPPLAPLPSQDLRKKVLLVIAALTASVTAAGLFFMMDSQKKAELVSQQEKAELVRRKEAQTLIDQVCPISRSLDLKIAPKKKPDLDKLRALVSEAKDKFEKLQVSSLFEKFTTCSKQADSAIDGGKDFETASSLAWLAYSYIKEQKQGTEEELSEAKRNLEKAINLFKEAERKALSNSKLSKDAGEEVKINEGFLKQLNEKIKKQRNDFDIRQIATNNLAEVKQFFNSDYAETNWYDTDQAKKIQDIQKQAANLQRNLSGIRRQAGEIEPLANKYKQTMEQVRLAFWIEENNLLALAESLTNSNFSDGSDKETLKKLDQGLQTFQLSLNSQKTLAENHMNAAITSLIGALAQYRNAIDLAQLCSRSSRSSECFVAAADGEKYMLSEKIPHGVSDITPYKYKSKDVVKFSDVILALKVQMKSEVEKARTEIKKSFSEGRFEL